MDAQTTTGSILGEVNDSSGGKLPGVTVTARNQENGASRETVTDALGTYTVSAALAGLGTVERKDVKLPIASQVALPFVLQIASLTETVNVTEQAPLVDTTEHVVKTLIDSQKIESLPLKSRDFLDLTMLAPGVVSDQGSASAGQTDSISFGGMSENYKSVWLEGVDFKAIDDQPVHYFFLIVAPPLEVSNQYLPVLGKIAQFAKESDVPTRLAKLQAPAEFLALLEEKNI